MADDVLFDDLDLAGLRARRSAKWRVYPPDVLPAWVAEMDFPLAEPVAAALRAAIDRDDTGYRWDGDLPEAFAADALHRFGWRVDPAVVRTAGDVLTSIAAVLRVVTEPGDGVVVNPPVYPPFFSTVRDLSGRRVVEAPLARDGDGWAYDLDAIEAAFRGGATAYLLCNPHNPTGLSLSRGELEAVATLAARYRVTILSDEVHAPMTLPGSTHTVLASMDGSDADVVTITSASKAWNVAGLKCAVMVPGSATTADRLSRMPIEVTFTTGHLGVLAAEAAYREGGPWLDRVVATLDRNRALLSQLLAERLPGVRYRPPAAGYLAWLDCTDLGLGDDPAAAFLERGRVALSSGIPFGTGALGWARLNMGTSASLLTEIVDRMALAVR